MLTLVVQVETKPPRQQVTTETVEVEGGESPLFLPGKRSNNININSAETVGDALKPATFGAQLVVHRSEM